MVHGPSAMCTTLQRPRGSSSAMRDWNQDPSDKLQTNRGPRACGRKTSFACSCPVAQAWASGPLLSRTLCAGDELSVLAVAGLSNCGVRAAACICMPLSPFCTEIGLSVQPMEVRLPITSKITDSFKTFKPALGISAASFSSRSSSETLEILGDSAEPCTKLKSCAQRHAQRVGSQGVPCHFSL